MKILKPPTAPPESEYIAKCQKCGCIFKMDNTAEKIAQHELTKTLTKNLVQCPVKDCLGVGCAHKIDSKRGQILMEEAQS